MLEETISQSIANDFKLISQGEGIYFQHHKPNVKNEPFHVHASIEVNYLEGCDMTYSFSGEKLRVPRNRFCIFWAAQPHRPTDLDGDGTITNAYVSLQEYLGWQLPDALSELLLAGAVVFSKEQFEDDVILARRWAAEIGRSEKQLSRLHCLELQAHLTRIAISGWEVVLPPRNASLHLGRDAKAVSHFEKMHRFVAQNFDEKIGLNEVSASASVSPNYANALFKRFLGTTVKAHIQEVRIYRARMLLMQTDDKVLGVAMDCGFRSVSSFYEAFKQATGLTPIEFRQSNS